VEGGVGRLAANFFPPRLQDHDILVCRPKQNQKNMKRKTFQEGWFDQHTRLRLTWDDDSCLAELSLQSEQANREIELQILQQAKDPRGLAVGPALILHRESIHCRQEHDPHWLVGRAWLPSRFASPHIRNCYFRIQPNSE